MVHTDIMVTKSDGSQELFQPEKLHKVLFWATDGLTNVSVSQIEIKAKLQLFQGIKTRDIHDIMVQSAHELITEDTPNYQYVAARLKLFQLRKDVFGGFEACSLYEIVQNNVARGVYTAELLEWYTEEEFNAMDAFVKHERDFNYAYAGIAQFIGKYLVQNRVTGKIYETPQICNVLIAATIFNNYKEKRLDWIKEFYNCLSQFDFSLPSPIMAGVRTPTKQFSSCVLLESDDSLESINRTAAATVNYASKKAGIGINGGALRAVGSEIRKGDAKHTGITPFYRYWQSALKSCSQGGMRGASATLYAPWWHYEIQTIMVLKNNKGTDDDRVRKLDYAISRNKLLFERFINNDKITLFSPHEVPDLMEAFYSDQDLFAELYVKYEKQRGIKKKKMSAKAWFEIFHTERKETGRLYYANIDHINTHSSFDQKVKPIRQSNLCLEITLPTEKLGVFETKVIESVKKEDLEWTIDSVVENGGLVKSIKTQDDGFDVTYDENTGRIQLCTLAAYNLGNMKNKEDMERPLEVLVRGLNEILDYQDYPQIEAKLATSEHRPLGIGISNLAYLFAKNGVKYGDTEAHLLWDETMEAFQYYLIQASCKLAQERGQTCTRFSDTKYSKGIMPIDTFKKEVNDIIPHTTRMDWKTLRANVKKFGMLNATLSAQMPVESSALVINATNGIEPPKGLVSEKENSGAIIRQVVPGIHHLRNKYDLLWDQPSCLGYLKIIAIQTKHSDQSVSGNTYFNPENFPQLEGDIPMSEMIQFDLLSYRWGIKTGYYCHTYDGAGDDMENDKSCADGACAV